MNGTQLITAIVQSADAPSRTAIVRPLEHPATALGPLAVATSVDVALVAPGAAVLVILYADAGGALIAVL